MKRFFIAAACLTWLVPAYAHDVEIVHCPKGCPTGTPAGNKTVVREIFTLSNNETTKFADWVAYRITSETIGTTDSLERKWESDPLLEEEDTLEPEDYDGAFRGSGSIGTHRGHQAPLAAFAGTVYWRETNILSNITPQKAALNGGSWMRLEGAVRHAATHLREIFVLTGPLYDANENQMALPKANETHKVPTGYWKVIYHIKPSGKAEASSFVFDQDVASNYKFCDARRSLSDVESLTGLDLFPEDSGFVQGNLDKYLGC